MGTKIYVKIRDRVLFCDSKWRSCHAYYDLLMSVYPHYTWVQFIHKQLSICGHYYAAITASTLVGKGLHKIWNQAAGIYCQSPARALGRSGTDVVR